MNKILPIDIIDLAYCNGSRLSSRSIARTLGLHGVGSCKLVDELIKYAWNWRCVKSFVDRNESDSSGYRVYIYACCLCMECILANPAYPQISGRFEFALHGL